MTLPITIGAIYRESADTILVESAAPPTQARAQARSQVSGTARA
jgi:hypothetical protein